MDNRPPFTLHHPFDLIEIRPRIVREAWVNVYPDGQFGSVFPTQEKARRAQSDTRPALACVKIQIDCEEGEGL